MLIPCLLIVKGFGLHALFRLSPGIDALVKKLHEKNKAVYLVSGGFRQMINVSFLLLKII